MGRGLFNCVSGMQQWIVREFMECGRSQGFRKGRGALGTVLFQVKCWTCFDRLPVCGGQGIVIPRVCLALRLALRLCPNLRSLGIVCGEGTLAIDAFLTAMYG
jgi:hypothetical protein